MNDPVNPRLPLPYPAVEGMASIVPEAKPSSAEEGMMRAIGQAAENVARTIGEKNVEAERVALDRLKEENRFRWKELLANRISLLGVALFLVPLVAYCLAKGKESLALDIIKGAVTLGALGFGAYKAGKANRRDDDD